MKTITLVILCFHATTLLGQTNSKVILDDLAKLQNQYNQTFDKSKVKDKLTVVYLLGKDTEDPFEKVLARFKSRSLKDPGTVQFVVGLKERISDPNPESAKDHLQGAVASAYGKDHFSILLEFNNAIATRLALKGWAIIELEKNKNAVVKDFGTDRKGLFDTINPFFN